LPQAVPPIDLKVDVYAVFDTRQGGISFDADGNLFVGNFGRDPADDPSRVFRVSPGGAAITESIDLFEDPDVLLVDVGGLEAAAGNVLIGGSTDLAVVGQLHEMTPDGQNVGTLEHMCLRNIGHLIFDRDDRLLVTNFNPAANVCAVKGGVVTELIADVVGGGPAGLTVQDPDTGDLFVTSENRVHRYDSDGALLMADYATGGVLAYGPAGSLFEGLLMRRSGVLLVRPDPESEDETALLMDSINGLVAFDANDNLYISDWPNGRVVRVSPNTLPPTAVGCP
jgi:sugar lactone lactonase YvrE